MKKKLVLLLVLVLAVNVMAGSYDNSVNWNGGVGDWMVAGNWTDVQNGSDADWDIPGWVVGNPQNTGGSTSSTWNQGIAHIESGTARITSSSKPDGRVQVMHLGGVGNTSNLEISGDVSTGAWYMNYSGNASTQSNVSQTAGNVNIQGYTTFGHNNHGNASYTLSGGSLTTSSKYESFGYNGGFAFNQTGGSYTDSGVAGSILFVGRYAGSGDAVVNVSGGTFTVDNTLDLGYYRAASFNQSGGTVSADQIKMASAAGSSGTTYTISGGSLDVGYFAGVQEFSGKFVVSGSGADSITIEQLSFYKDTLKVELDDNGSTLIKVDGTSSTSYMGASLYRAVLEVDTLASFDGVAGDVYDILWSVDTLNTTFMDFSNLSGTQFDWDVIQKDGGDMLQLTVVPEPATMVLLGLGSLMFVRKR